MSGRKSARFIYIKKKIRGSAGACFFIAFDVGRTLPNTDLSRDFMGLVVDGSMDLGTHIWHPRRFFCRGG